MKKIFLLALSTAFFISCSDEAPVTNVAEETRVEEGQNQDEIFAKFSNFTIDGQNTSDKTKIKEAMQTATVINYVPEASEVHFYTSDEKYGQLTNTSVKDLRSYQDPDKDALHGFGLNYDVEGSSDHELETKEGDIAKNYDYGGISGLSSLAGNSTYTDFAKKVYFIADYDSGTTYIIRSDTSNADLWAGTPMRGVKMTSSVKAVQMALGYSFRNLYSYNNLDLFVRNDQGGTRRVVLYENTNYGGQAITITLSKDQLYQFSRYQFSNFSADRPRSLKVLN